MNFLARCTFALALLLAAIAPAAAFADHESVHGDMRPVERPTLTAADVEKVVKALPELLALTDKYHGSHGTAADAKAPDQAAADQAYLAALGQLAGRHQFADTTSMQQLVETVMLTAGFINSGKSVQQIEDQMAEQQKKIEADATLTPEQKDALKRRMAIQVSMVVPSQQNVDTVRPYFDQVMAVAAKKQP
jgi:formate dehydrogenase assembly factor FdhD